MVCLQKVSWEENMRSNRQPKQTHFIRWQWPWVVMLILCSSLAQASSDEKYDHERARQMHEAGEIVSGQSLVKKALVLHPGARVLEIELEEKRGRLLYEIEIVDKDGNVHELYFDARDGQLWQQRLHD